MIVLRKQRLVITKINRAYNSVDGNPRWRIAFDNGEFSYTLKDSTLGYEITESMVGKTFDVSLVRGGIGDLEEVK